MMKKLKNCFRKILKLRGWPKARNLHINCLVDLNGKKYQVIKKNIVYVVLQERQKGDIIKIPKNQKIKDEIIPYVIICLNNQKLIQVFPNMIGILEIKRSIQYLEKICGKKEKKFADQKN